MASDILSSDERQALDIATGKIHGPNIYECVGCGGSHEAVDEVEAAEMKNISCPFWGQSGYKQRDQ